jgi:hypothetical protein
MDELARNRYPSVDWKQDLRYYRHRFAEDEHLGEGIASVCRTVERYVMHSALAVRKLLDQRVLTEEVIEREWHLRDYPCTKDPEDHWYFEGMIDLENLHHFVRFYNTEARGSGTLRLERLANILIHAFVFAVWPAEEGDYSGARFFFNSDHYKNRLVFELTIAEFEDMVDSVLEDRVAYMERVDGDFRQHNAAWAFERGYGYG